jgi:hypothetical protein
MVWGQKMSIKKSFANNRENCLEVLKSGKINIRHAAIVRKSHAGNTWRHLPYHSKLCAVYLGMRKGKRVFFATD